MQEKWTCQPSRKSRKISHLVEMGEMGKKLFHLIQLSVNQMGAKWEVLPLVGQSGNVSLPEWERLK